MNNELQAMVIGQSGDGKSEFILSFIDKEHKKFIPASGQGQTTRTSMTYSISPNFDELEIITTLCDAESFVEERVKKATSYFNERVKSIDDFIKILNSKLKRKGFKEKLICSKAFFDHKEFECSNKIEELFDKLFGTELTESEFIIDNKSQEEKSPFDMFDVGISSDYVKKIFDETSDTNDENKSISFGDVIDKFYKNIYKLCFGEFKEKCQLWGLELKVKSVDISSLTKDEELNILPKFFKTVDGQTSYTSLIKTINVKAGLNLEYKDFFKEHSIEKLTLIDTYGLNHDTTLERNILSARFYSLLSKDYPDIQSVFYVRDIFTDEPPSDLAITLPIITKTKPNIVSYIIYTRIDKLAKIEEYKTKKAFTSLDEVQDNIADALFINNLSEYLIMNRLEVLNNTKIGYASVLPSDDPDKYKKLLEHNIGGLSSLFRAIINQSHLGTEYVDIDKLNDVINSICDTNNEILQSRKDVGMIHWKTQDAIVERFRRGILGFTSTNEKNNLDWDYMIRSNINLHFTNLNEEIVSCFSNDDKIKTTLFELLAKSGTEILKSEVLDVEVVEKNNYNNIKGKLYNDRKVQIDNLCQYGRRSIYLKEVYDFSNVNANICEYVKAKLNKILISFGLDYNARLLAETLKPDLTDDAIDSLYETFYDAFYNSATDEDKFNFESIVEIKRKHNV